MQTLLVLDQQNYDPESPRFSREAVRAILLNGRRIALVKSLRDGYYKFPGGGIEAGETHVDTLIRETLEETGLHILPSSIREFGMIHEIRRSLFDRRKIFEQKSYYYTADWIGEPMPDGYEAEKGSILTWVDIRKAYETNMQLASVHPNSDFLLREAEVLKLLLPDD